MAGMLVAGQIRPFGQRWLRGWQCGIRAAGMRRLGCEREHLARGWSRAASLSKTLLASEQIELDLGVSLSPLSCVSSRGLWIIEFLGVIH